jgi:hypothetical protein
MEAPTFTAMSSSGVALRDGRPGEGVARRSQTVEGRGYADGKRFSCVHVQTGDHEIWAYA